MGAAVGGVGLADDQPVALELVEQPNQACLVIADRLSERWLAARGLLGFTLFFPDDTTETALAQQMTVVQNELHTVRALCEEQARQT